MVQPSCPVLVIHPDDAFRRALVVALDQANFAVATATEGTEALAALRQRSFRVVLVGLKPGDGDRSTDLEELRQIRESISCGVIIIGEPDPAVRTMAPWADETFLKPVDVGYVVSRAKKYCNC